MLIWALFAGMTAVAALIVLAPLARRAKTSEETASGDVSVYRDQLDEIDRDLANGLVASSEADAARAEIARRLLRAARRDENEAVAAPSRRARLVAVLAVVLVPLVSIGTYLTLGHPDMPDMPLSGRAARAAGGQSIDDLVARVESHLAQNPDDARGWEVIVPVYMRLGRADDAVRAVKNAIRIAGPTERRQIGLGEALVAAGDGHIGDEARAAFAKALEIEPRSVLPRMYLAAAFAQDGKLADAAAAWATLVASASPTDEWLPVARAELAKAEAAAGLPPSAASAAAPTTPSAPAPTADQVEAAGQMSAADRSAMIADMVGRLDARLKASGGSIDEWERLVRAQKVMGRLDDARASLARARTALASDPAALTRLDALAQGL
jgi:cytochrome c-type biogenesis protein CcmH